ncbi:transposase [Sphingobacterium sp. DK4209]|uniref:Transposase n=1 Tax=Sphingobacterium zhuxiongii TaxID=2662364 RepID=A0A5Q0QGH3_9SPHI|nr:MULTISPECIES: transposase [unclassified Sphingobacterium]MVZ66558.1 transposase [Sphingobacterium sp. DK4209]QGA26742.1 transposase [Sphingobacterium sp. dk4302]
MHESFNALMPLIIPEGVSDYFEMTHYSKEEKRLDIFLEELNTTPEEYQGQKLISKGFFEPVTLQDFPIRGMQVYLHVKRRRWLNQDTDKVVYRNWELVAKGTRITQDFAAFLKGISGQPGS